MHVVHFDGHGVYDARQGLGYLALENERHSLDLVDADRLGNLLAAVRHPADGAQRLPERPAGKEQPLRPVAARLIRAGVGSVLAMNYTVLVAATRRFAGGFYGALVQGRTVGQAVDEGRRALMADEERYRFTWRNAKGELVEQALHLRDWFLPALYQQADDPVVFASPHVGPDCTGERPVMNWPYRRRSLAPSPPPSPIPTPPAACPPTRCTAFTAARGRLLRLERALAERRWWCCTASAAWARRPWPRRRAAGSTAPGASPAARRSSPSSTAGRSRQFCSWVGQAVSGEANWGLGNPELRKTRGGRGRSPGGRRGEATRWRVGQLLRERPALVILDNFESVLGRDALMPPEELKAVLDAVWSWADGAAASAGRSALPAC